MARYFRYAVSVPAATMTTAATATQRSTCRLPVRGCLRMRDLLPRLVTDSLAQRIPRARCSQNVTQQPGFHPYQGAGSNQLVRGQMGPRKNGGLGSGQAAQGGAHHGGVGGGPERGQRGPEEVAVAGGHQPGIE